MIGSRAICIELTGLSYFTSFFSELAEPEHFSISLEKFLWSWIGKTAIINSISFINERIWRRVPHLMSISVIETLLAELLVFARSIDMLQLFASRFHILNVLPLEFTEIWDFLAKTNVCFFWFLKSVGKVKFQVTYSFAIGFFYNATRNCVNCAYRFGQICLKEPALTVILYLSGSVVRKSSRMFRWWLMLSKVMCDSKSFCLYLNRIGMRWIFYLASCCY